MPPKAWRMQPNTLVRPSSSPGQVSVGNFHTPSSGFVPRSPNMVNSNHSAMMMGDLVGRPLFGDGQVFNSWGGYHGLGNFAGPPTLGDGQGFNCSGGYDGTDNLLCQPTFRGSQGCNGWSGSHGMGNFAGLPPFVDGQGFNCSGGYNGTENLLGQPTFRDGWGGYNGKGNLVVPPPYGVEQRFDCGGTFGEMTSNNGAYMNVIDTTNAKEKAQKEGTYSCKTPPKCDPQSLSPVSSGNLCVSKTSYMSRKGALSNDLHQGLSSNDKNPIGRGVITQEVKHLLPLPTPSLRYEGKFATGEKTSVEKGGKISKLNHHDRGLMSDKNDNVAATDEDDIFDEDDLFDEDDNELGDVPEQDESHQSRHQALVNYSNHEKQEIGDHYIVWPPMVIIMNPKYEKDEHDKDLLDYFKDYKVVSAKQSYGPLGHCGMSVLLFESSPLGYQDSEKLHKHFLELRRGRSAWKELFYTARNLQLYGFLANKSDLDEFNKYCQEKERVRFEIKTYEEMIVAPMRRMTKDIQLLNYFRKQATKEQKKVDALEQSLNFVTEKLRKTMEANQILRQRIKMQHEEHMEEMEFLEKFFKSQILEVQNAKHAEGGQLKFQDERNMAEKCYELSLSIEELSCRMEELNSFNKSQDQELETSLAEEEQLKLMCKKKKKRRADTTAVQVQEEEVV